MQSDAANRLGSVVALWRYPIKSMMGEEVNASVLGQRGILGDARHSCATAARVRRNYCPVPREQCCTIDLR